MKFSIYFLIAFFHVSLYSLVLQKNKALQVYDKILKRTNSNSNKGFHEICLRFENSLGYSLGIYNECLMIDCFDSDEMKLGSERSKLEEFVKENFGKNDTVIMFDWFCPFHTVHYVNIYFKSGIFRRILLKINNFCRSIKLKTDYCYYL